MTSMSQLFGELRSAISSLPGSDPSAFNELLKLLKTAQELSPEEYKATWAPYLKQSSSLLNMDLPLISRKRPQELMRYAQLIPLPICEFRGMWLSGAKTLEALDLGIGEYLCSLELQQCNLNEAKLTRLLSDASLKHLQVLKIQGLQKHVVTAQHIHALAASPSASTLHTLHLNEDVMTEDALAALCEHDEFTSLHTLHIDTCELDVFAIHKLARAPFAHQLVELLMREFRGPGNPQPAPSTHDAWLEAMQMLSTLNALQRLYLTELGITNHTLEALGMHNAWFARLDKLEFYRGLRTRPDREGITMFLEHAKLSDSVRQSFAPYVQ